jgi:hypothetical protein
LKWFWDRFWLCYVVFNSQIFNASKVQPTVKMVSKICTGTYIRPIHVWHSRTTAGVWCANFPSVITTIIDHSAVVETVEQTWVVCHVAESYAKQLNICNLTKVNGIPETNSEKNTKQVEILLLTKRNETKRNFAVFIVSRNSFFVSLCFALFRVSRNKKRMRNGNPT